jgi:hypothetical protein
MAQTERFDAMGEILSQDQGFLDYFTALLTITPQSHPAIWKIMNLAVLIGLFAAMHFKLIYSRPRPSQICPALLPCLPVPGHASYPSGHSTQAHLVANCLIDVIQTPGGANAVMMSDLTALANRIARNRELAGLHYPSDSGAGVQLASNLFDLLSGSQMPATEGPPGSKTSKYIALRDLARSEWS